MLLNRRHMLSLAAASALGQKREKPPNILLLFADQHQADAISCAGGVPRTPHLDRLAAGGVRFERAYCQDGICVPSRTSMMTGQYPRTTVIYASDHGDFAAGHGMIEKCALGHNVYEETLRVPLIVNYPKVARKPAVRSDLVELVDLYPTVLDLTGLPRPSEYALPGRSLVATLRDGSPLGRKYAISENWSQVSVIGERYKLGQWLEPPAPQYDYRSFGDVLFDRVSDPSEVRNLAGNEGVKTAEQDLRRYLQEWSAATPAHAKKLAAPNALKPPAQRKK